MCGIRPATRHYFGKSFSELTLVNGAMLLSQNSVRTSRPASQPLKEFYVDVKWEEPGGFVPATPNKLPLRQSSRLEWTNLEQWSALRQRNEQALRIRFKYLGAKIEMVPGQNRWSAIYSAEIDDICLAPNAKRSRHP